MSEKTYCPNCGEELSKDYRFCPNCGKEITKKREKSLRKSETSFDIEENVEGIFCYLAWWVTGIVFYAVEEENKFVQFHAIQSILIFIPLSIIVWILNILPHIIHLWSNTGWIIFTGARFLIWIGIFFLWFILMIKAYQGELFKLPIVGDIAEDQIK